jgi:hypothetical protein
MMAVQINNQPSIMKTILKSGLTLTILVALCTAGLAGSRFKLQDQSGTPLRPYDPPVDQNGNSLLDPVVYNLFCPAAPNPLIAPDNHQITLGEWIQANGNVSLQCTRKGTVITAAFTGLIPNAVYSVWIVVWGPGPANPDGSNLIGVGPVGAIDGSQNHFVSSSTGTGGVSALTPAETLSEIPYPIGACLLSNSDPNIGEVDIAVGYHLDGQTHGGVSSPDPCAFALQLGFPFFPR